MRIGLIALKAGTHAGGIATYETQLIHALAAIDRENEHHVLCVAPVTRSVFAIDQPNFHFHEVRPRQRTLAMCVAVPRLLRQLDVDFFHVLFLPPLTFPRPFVFTAHGPEMFVDPTFFPLHIRVRLLPLIRRCYRRASSILCVSGDMREHLVRWRPDAASRSRVVYNGCLDIFRPQDPEQVQRTLRERFRIDFPYMLAVGRVEPRKNPIGLLRAYARFRQASRQDVKLVIAGGQTWSRGEAHRTIDELQLREHVVLLGHVEHEQLPALYAGARCFVFPSLWEGFGLPLVEAMRCGCPTIASNVSCLPEVAGGASLLVDPKDEEAIAQAMVELVEDESLRRELIARGLARGAQFTWERCARETLAAYRDLGAQLRRPPR